jgi:hypothetical protein
MAFGTFLGTKEPFPLDGYQETMQFILDKVYLSRAFLASKLNFYAVHIVRIVVWKMKHLLTRSCNTVREVCDTPHAIPNPSKTVRISDSVGRGAVMQ